ncbi:hypothetical protein [Streptomyces fungicidicus]|uniref:hypothetical protein n=1 Tax=Streptomyces fungicidicus TaxID=68203 RepID=UPI0037F34B23
MSTRDKIFHAMSFGPCSPNAARELLDRIEQEARTAGSVDQQRELRRLELLESSLVDYINHVDTPDMVGHVLTLLMTVAAGKANDEFPTP